MALTPIISQLPIGANNSGFDSDEFQAYSFTCPQAQKLKGISIVRPNGTDPDSTELIQIMTGGTRGKYDGDVVAEVSGEMFKGGFCPLDIALATDDILTVYSVRGTSNVGQPSNRMTLWSDVASDWRIAKDFFEAGSRLTWSTTPTYTTIAQAPHSRKQSWAAVADATKITTPLTGMGGAGLIRAYLRSHSAASFKVTLGLNDSVAGVDAAVGLETTATGLKLMLNGSLVDAANDVVNVNSFEYVAFNIMGGNAFAWNATGNDGSSNDVAIANNVNFSSIVAIDELFVEHTGGGGGAIDIQVAFIEVF